MRESRCGYLISSRIAGRGVLVPAGDA